MERKYYLRGLGLGIVVTAVIMGMALSGQKNMTDEEVIARARTLGMVENTENMLLSDTAAQEDDEAQEAEETEQVADPAEQEPQEAVTEEAVMEENSQADVSEGDNTEEEDSEDTQAVTSAQESDPADAKQPETDASETQTEQVAAETESTDNQQEVTITIVSGDSSYSVAKKLADAGIVLTAESYDAYLCANGYDKKLRTGTFAIPKTASDEQIARIVTGMENP